jgi:hypothetical protein
VSYKLSIELPKLPHTQVAGTTGGHWSKRLKEKRWWIHQVYWYALEAGLPPEPLQKATVTITRRSEREPDYDNQVASCKFPLDALVVAKVIADDSPQTITLVCRWEKARRFHGSLLIEVSGE